MEEADHYVAVIPTPSDQTATRVAANTATTWMLQQTTVRTAELDAEVQRHVQLLNSQGGR